VSEVLQAVDRLAVYISQAIARRTGNDPFWKTFFISFLTWFNKPFRFRASTEWCEVWYTAGDCYFPFGQGTCKRCRSDSPCPQGYHVSYAYDYTTTGCWCRPQTADLTKVCCDCTPSWNNPYFRHPQDCQCGHNVHHH
jgi:hypothetical protein